MDVVKVVKNLGQGLGGPLLTLTVCGGGREEVEGEGRKKFVSGGWIEV